MGARRFIAAIAFGFLAASSATAVPAASGTLSIFMHPALLSAGVRAAFAAAPVPLGLAAHVIDLMDIGRYASGTQREPTIDLGTFILGLTDVEILPMNQPSSPDTISLMVSADAVELTSSGGDFDVVQLLRRVSTSSRRAALDSPMLPIHSFPAGRLRFDLGYLVSAVPLDAVAGISSLDLVSGAALAPNMEYDFSLRSVADVSVAVRSTFGVPVQLNRAVLRPAVTSTVPVSLAHAESIVRTRVQTGADGIPSGFGSDWDVFLWYPGTGVGLGAKVSAGASLTVGTSTVALTLASVYSGWWARGVRSGSAGSVPDVIVDSGFNMWPVVAYAAGGHAGGDCTTAVFLQAGYRGALLGSAAVEWSVGSVSVVAGIGFERGVRVGAGLGIWGRRLYSEFSVEARTTQDTGTAAVGLIVSLARITPERNRY